jgi:aminopeptidase N
VTSWPRRREAVRLGRIPQTTSTNKERSSMPVSHVPSPISTVRSRVAAAAAAPRAVAPAWRGTTRMRRLVLALAGGLAPVALARADTYPRQPGVDAIHYEFRLSLGDDSDEIAGETTATLRMRDGGVREVVLDLASPRDGKGMTVEAVTAAGQAARFEHADDRLRVFLPAAPAAGTDVRIAVRYRGVPADGLRFLRNIHGARTVFSENWPNRAREWLPVIDHPSDKASGDILVTAPAHYQVVANGVLVEQLDLPDGRRLTHWRQTVPIASWLYAIGVARFAVHHAGSVADIPIQTWVFPEDRDRGYALFEETTRRALAFFIDRIGPYAYEKLANVQAAGISGGTEHATAIFYGEKGVAAGRAPIVHEIAHQWWGNAVTESDWDDVWLSEGFATYFTLLFTEHAEGRDAFVAGLRRSRQTVVELQRKLPDAPVIHRNLSDMRRVLNGLIYQKGGWTLHMLRRLVGTDVFWRGIRDYYRRYRNANASTDDFRQVMEQASGQDLAWFFRQWLTRSDLPRIEATWRADAGGRGVEVTVRQTQPGEPYRLTVEIGLAIEGQAEPRVERIEVAGREATARFTVEGTVRDVVLDPETWLLVEEARIQRDGGPAGR